MAIYEIDPSLDTIDDLRSSPSLMATAMSTYTTKASGPLTEIPSSVSYLPFSSVIPPSSLNQITSLLPNPTASSSPFSTLRHRILLSRFNEGSRLGQIEYNFDTSNYSPYFVSEPGKKYATMMMMLQYPFSVGSIHIPPSSSEEAGKKTSMHEKPIIDPQYYQGPGGEIDFQTMVSSQIFADKIVNTAPLSSIIVKRVFPPLPPTSSLAGAEKEKEDFSDFVRNYTITDWHPVGTCGMGPLGEKGEGGVLDARLRVHGVKGLRVVDASVMPLQISAHIQATIYAIGEKGASLILEDYKE